jgi:hypothetical protein
VRTRSTILALAVLLAGTVAAAADVEAATFAADVGPVLAAERPGGGWTFGHPPGKREKPFSWLLKTAERIARPFGLATWDVVANRSPGTPAAALLLLEDGSPAAVAAARRAGDLLLETQLPMGGWPAEMPVYGRELPEWDRLLMFRPAIDDDVTPGGVRLLLRLWKATGDVRYRAGAERAIDFLLREQDPSGGWPLSGRPEWLHRVHPHSGAPLALNDGATPFTITTLLEAAETLGRPDLRAAAVHGAEWLVRVRGDRPAWAQQYHVDGTPAGARPFEVPALATWETRHAIEALLTVARATNDDRFCAPALTAVAWLERVAIGPGCWARFHDLVTGKPLYVDANGRRVATPWSARPRYSWIGAFGIPALLARLGRAAPPAFGAPLPGDPGVCPDRPPVTRPLSGPRGAIARLGRARPVERLDLGPCG